MQPLIHRQDFVESFGRGFAGRLTSALIGCCFSGVTLASLHKLLTVNSERLLLHSWDWITASRLRLFFKFIAVFRFCTVVWVMETAADGAQWSSASLQVCSLLTVHIRLGLASVDCSKKTKTAKTRQTTSCWSGMWMPGLGGSTPPHLLSSTSLTAPSVPILRFLSFFLSYGRVADSQL